MKRPAVHTPPPFSGLRVLYVEDNNDDYLMAKDLMEDLVTDLDMHHAATAEAARAALASKDFDLLLLDHVLPPGAGRHEIGTSIAEHCIESRIKVPTILLTGMHELTLSHQLLDLVASGSMGFIFKNDLDHKLLRRSLNRLLQPAVRTLLVDADREECELFEQLIEESRLNRIRMDVAADIESAHDNARALRYDVIFIDHNQDMGEISSFLTQLAQQPSPPGMVLITGFRMVDLPPALLGLIENEQLLLQPKAALSAYRLTETILYFSKTARAERDAETGPHGGPV